MKIVVAKEGENFGSGFVLAEGSVTWDQETLPLYWNGDYERGPIGSVTNIRREGKDIVADVQGFETSAYLRKIDTKQEEGENRIITQGLLAGISIVPTPACRAV